MLNYPLSMEHEFQPELVEYRTKESLSKLRFYKEFYDRQRQHDVLSCSKFRSSDIYFGLCSLGYG